MTETWWLSHILDLVLFRIGLLKSVRGGASSRSMARRGELLVYAFTLFVAACGAGLFLNGFFPDAPLSSSRDGPGGSSGEDPDLRQAPKVENRTPCSRGSYDACLTGNLQLSDENVAASVAAHAEMGERKLSLSEYTSLGRRG